MEKIVSDVKKTNIDPTDTADLGRRRALARLGLTAAAAYAAPTLLSLTAAKAKDGDSGGGDDNSGPGGGDNSGPGGSGGDDNSGPSGNNSTPTSPSGPDDNGSDLMDATQPTSPSSDDSAAESN